MNNLLSQLQQLKTKPVITTFLSFVLSKVCTVVFGYLSVVCLKWSPQTEHYLRALALPVWAILLLYIGMCKFPAHKPQ